MPVPVEAGWARGSIEMNKLVISVVATLGAAALWANSAHALVAWTNSSGSGTGFSWANGGSTNGLYGDPSLVGGNTLLFFPNAFRAESSNGVTDTITDTIFVDIISGPGQEITAISINEFGDWAINASGQIDINASLTVIDLNNPLRQANDTMAVNPGSIITTPGSGSWDGSVMIDLSAIVGDAWTWIHIELSNTLTAQSSTGTSSFVEKKVAGAGIQMTVIPAPGAATLLGLGTLLATRRRRT